MVIRSILILNLCILGCSESKHGEITISTSLVNSIMSQVDENSLAFTEKGITFDSIVTLAGHRTLEGQNIKLKMKLFYFNDHCRGYFNLPALDNKNLQVFGKKVDDRWAIKCVTKLNMEEAGGYMIWDVNTSKHNGVWSTGHVNFKQGNLSLVKQTTDYNILTEW